uniref:Uncharacterized protein n=1 Tax=Anguilla anguilla TaxID=7936 RepID=A0A0E9PX54_ANGAN
MRGCVSCGKRANWCFIKRCNVS